MTLYKGLEIEIKVTFSLNAEQVTFFEKNAYYEIELVSLFIIK